MYSNDWPDQIFEMLGTIGVNFKIKYWTLSKIKISNIYDLNPYTWFLHRYMIDAEQESKYLRN